MLYLIVIKEASTRFLYTVYSSVFNRFLNRFKLFPDASIRPFSAFSKSVYYINTKKNTKWAFAKKNTKWAFARKHDIFTREDI